RDGKLVYVDPGDGLHIAVEPDRDVYQPGEEARLRFRVTDGEGMGQAAALGIQVVDEAVFGLIEFRPGLEKTYFQIEAELGQPRYQIGVPSLTELAADPGASSDPTRQEEARLLFAATDPSAAYPLAVNTHLQAQALVATVVRPLVEATAQQYLERLRNAVEAGWLDQGNLQASVNAGFAATYDPWGRLLQARMEDGWTIKLSSLGPDELSGTPDDVSLTYGAGEVLYGKGHGQGRNGGWDGEGEWEGDWDFAGAEDGEAMPGPPNAGGEGEGEGEPGEAGGGGGDAPRVRRSFPETLLVEPALITDGTGTAELAVPLADSITTWRLSALANSAEGLLGSTDAGLRVFQDFFVDIDFPATLTRNDEFHVPIALYNYLDEPQTVRIELAPAPWLTLLGPGSARLDLGPGEVRGLRIPVRVEQVGVHELTVFAYGSVLQDAVARTVEVVPDGSEVRRSVTGRLAEGTIRHEVLVPEQAIPGSGKLFVKIYPGLLSQVLEGLDGVLRMPSGCFEQTSSSTWPNVLVTRYLRETSQMTPDLDVRASEFINVGYQRLLTFEVDGGGFEWFGRPPAHVVLSAYGLLEFTDMAQIRTVDQRMIERTRSWLLAQQQADGRWQAARGLDETGLLSDPATITAYVAFGLAAAGERSAALDRARAYLETRLAGMGTYTMALFANFMVAYQPEAALTTRLLDELAGRVDSSVQGGGGQGGDGQGGEPPSDQSHWETDEQTTTYGNGVPAWVETTALATHALL
ncbi:MAG: alpha-2-macroglobulin, partial [Deltaproteobacteria bacterium]|nr:alpha-2-macroglobulin [Deltaproteobacteria bacterium]